MGYSSTQISKLDYARFAASSIAYLANQQRDAAGVIVFDDDIRNYVRPSTRQGQFHRLVHAIEHAELGKRTDFAKPFLHFQEFLKRRGIVLVLSDFWEQPETVIRTVQPLRFKGNELILFHVLDPQEIQPVLREPSLLVDMETQEAIEVSPDFAKHEYRDRVDAHIEALRSKAKASGIDYFLLRTDRPLDDALREYLTIRQGRM